MEKNTVILSIEDYIDLRDFKTEILKGSILSTNGYSANKFVVVNKDKVIETLTNDNAILASHKKQKEDIIYSLKVDIEKYKEKFGELTDTKSSDKQKELTDKIKSLTIWDFIKIKFKQ